MDIRERIRDSFLKRPLFYFCCLATEHARYFCPPRHSATFFIVGKDLEMESARKFCNLAIKAGHALGNHTYTHRTDFGTLTFEEKQYEIKNCHNAILNATGQKPIGFRAPGYYLDQDIINILYDLGYKYDSSVLPGYANFFMRFYMHRVGQLSKEKAFGRNRYLFVSRKPCMVHGTEKNSSLYEFPISVLPLLRSPTHSTFLFLLGRT